MRCGDLTRYGASYPKPYLVLLSWLCLHRAVRGNRMDECHLLAVYSAVLLGSVCSVFLRTKEAPRLQPDQTWRHQWRVYACRKVYSAQPNLQSKKPHVARCSGNSLFSPYSVFGSGVEDHNRWGHFTASMGVSKENSTSLRSSSVVLAYRPYPMHDIGESRATSGKSHCLNHRRRTSRTTYMQPRPQDGPGMLIRRSWLFLTGDRFPQ
ncbi:hypothetical protein K474DRAFT_885617 [Panus rudis PR-1116 ss-1]|nr:hypothetical protein K474DRAFT_885617 [Panus rudis PR-1116 ss-1]